ncbi:unnamed protein product [Caenorhabditis nigoni]
MGLEATVVLKGKSLGNLLAVLGMLKKSLQSLLESKITKFVFTLRQKTHDQIEKDSKKFVTAANKYSPLYPYSIYTSDQSGFQIEMNTAGTLAFKLSNNVHCVKMKKAPRLTADHRTQRLDFVKTNSSRKWDDSDEKKWNIDGLDGNKHRRITDGVGRLLQWKNDEVTIHQDSSDTNFLPEQTPEGTILECTKNGMTSSEIFKIFDVAKSTANQTFVRFRKIGTLNDMRKSGRPVVNVTTPEAVKARRKSEGTPKEAPDLNPMDFPVWVYLTQQVSTKNYPKLNALKKALTAAWDNLNVNYLRAVVDSYPNRLQAVIKAKGGRFENC